MVAAADQRHLYAKTSITNIAIKVENDQQENVRKLTQAHGVMTQMVHATLHKDLQLSKKLARWMTILVDKEIKKEQVRTCEASVDIFAAVSSQSWTTFSLRVSRRRAKKGLIGLTSPGRPPRRTGTGLQEISRWRTSLTRSGGDMSDVRGVSRLAMDTWKKLRNANHPVFVFINVVRIISKPTLYFGRTGHVFSIYIRCTFFYTKFFFKKFCQTNENYF
jgi:hypothetical protein